MKKTLIFLVSLAIILPQASLLAAQGTASNSPVRPGQQQMKTIGKQQFEGPLRTTAKDKLSTSGHRNDREGTEDADMPLPDGVKRNKLQPSAGRTLNDTPRNPVQGR